MSRMLKPAAAGLAVSSLCLSFIAEVPAQTGSKKKSAIVQTQVLDDVAPSRAKAPVDTEADADQRTPAKGTKAGRLPRPEAQPLRIPKLDPELEEVLQEWERQTSQFKKLVGEFSVFKYDPTFEVERRGEGKFAYEAPDKGNYERKGSDIKGQKAKKKNKNGEPYTLQSDSPERWVCTGKEIIRIDEKEKTYEKISIPPEAQGQNIIEGPLPFLFGMKAQQAKMRYKMKLKSKTESEIILQLVPIKQADASNWERATVIIDAKRFVPKAVQHFDPTGGETVHVFKNVEINPKRGWLDADPFKPNLRGYKPTVSSDLQSSAPLDKPTTAAKPRTGSDTTSRTANSSDAPVRRATNTK